MQEAALSPLGTVEAVGWHFPVSVTHFLMNSFAPLWESIFLILCWLLFPSGPWESSPRLVLGPLPVSTYAPFFLGEVNIPGLNNGFNAGVSQFTFAALSCHFHLSNAYGIFHLDDPSLA